MIDLAYTELEMLKGSTITGIDVRSDSIKIITIWGGAFIFKHRGNYETRKVYGTSLPAAIGKVVSQIKVHVSLVASGLPHWETEVEVELLLQDRSNLKDSEPCYDSHILRFAGGIHDVIPCTIEREEAVHP